MHFIPKSRSCVSAAIGIIGAHRGYTRTLLLGNTHPINYSCEHYKKAGRTPLPTLSTKPNTANSGTFFEIEPPELAKTEGLGRHVCKITVTGMAGETPSQEILPELLQIFQHCPNVISLAGCWKQPLGSPKV
jgi:hypothetical protein